MFKFLNRRQETAKRTAMDGHSMVCTKLEDGRYEVMVALVGNWKTRKMNVTLQRLQEMVNNFNADKLPLLFDYDHMSFWGDCSRAAAWGESLEIRGDKLYCIMKPTPDGLSAIENQEYKYLSPVFTYRRIDPVTGEIKEDWYLESVAFTNTPFLTELPAMTNKKNEMEESRMEWWKTLGYASEEDAIAKINQMKNDLATANSQVTDLTAQLTAEKDKNADLLSKANTAEVEAAVLAKKIMPGQKEIALKLINSDRALYDEFVTANTGVTAADLGKETKLPVGEGGNALDKVTSYKQLLDDATLCKQYETERPAEYKKLYDTWMKDHK
jgi:phage I-like protein